MGFLVDLLIVLERIFELIIEFGSAWSTPLVALVIAITAWKFRYIISGLASRVGKIKLGENVMEFDAERSLKEAREQLRDLPIEPKRPAISAHILETINISPEYSVMQSWDLLEEVVQKAASALEVKLTSDQLTDISSVAQAIANQQGLSENFQ